MALLMGYGLKSLFKLDKYVLLELVVCKFSLRRKTAFPKHTENNLHV